MADNSRGDNAPTNNSGKAAPKPKCGIIMPISAIDGLSEAHWLEVNGILTNAIVAAGFEADLVSTAEEVGIIQKTIIQNLYENPVVVCDVSGKNPNVMFELGMRLAFDKPTIIVKDDKTSYTFDTSSIEHLNYPRDLRFGGIVDFKNKLTDKVRHTYNKATSDASYTTFLKHFGEFTVAKIEQKEVSSQEFIMEELRTLKQLVARLDRQGRYVRPTSEATGSWLEFDTGIWTSAETADVVSKVQSLVPDGEIEVSGGRLLIALPDWMSRDKVEKLEEIIAQTVKEKPSSVVVASVKRRNHPK